MSDRQKADYDLTQPATVDLRMEVANPTAAALKGKGKLNKARQVPIGTVICPPGGACTIAVPKQVKVRIGGKEHSVTVLAPKTLNGGKTGVVTARFPSKSAMALAGKSVRVSVEVDARNQEVAKVLETIVRTIKG